MRRAILTSCVCARWTPRRLQHSLPASKDQFRAGAPRFFRRCARARGPRSKVELDLQLDTRSLSSLSSPSPPPCAPSSARCSPSRRPRTCCSSRRCSSGTPSAPPRRRWRRRRSRGGRRSSTSWWTRRSCTRRTRRSRCSPTICLRHASARSASGATCRRGSARPSARTRHTSRGATV